MDRLVIYVIALNPIRIKTCSAPQNDDQNLSFKKDINEVGKKMDRNDHKIGNSKSCIFFHA